MFVSFGLTTRFSIIAALKIKLKEKCASYLIRLYFSLVFAKTWSAFLNLQNNQ